LALATQAAEGERTLARLKAWRAVEKEREEAQARAQAAKETAEKAQREVEATERVWKEAELAEKARRETKAAKKAQEEARRAEGAAGTGGVPALAAEERMRPTKSGAKGKEVAGTGTGCPVWKRARAAIVVDSDNDEDKVSGPSTRKVKKRGLVVVIPAHRVEFRTPPPDGEEDEDKLGAAVRSAGKAVEGMAWSIHEFGMAMGRIGQVIGKYNLCRD
jgi:multidrug efflux pump subunit AcrA (membrane-fusion protein)